MHRIHGFLPVPKRTPQTEALFPHNIELRVADWVTEEEAEDKDEADAAAATTTRDSGAEQWDVILGFSLAKWIHLHHGDAGLKRFFQKVYRSLAPGGLFLFEPQAFDTYRKRSKLAPAMEENYKAIALKPEAFREYLLSDEVGFREAQHLGHSDGAAKNFNRDIFLFRK
ncbi:hypothetical protein BGZ98_002432 [Dissophora globulifera]|nr:hypothetical protein BGZ98_002432 [Dissophora globulifera]